jgi:hypothetical protein
VPRILDARDLGSEGAAVLSKKSYGELLKDPRWQRRRLEILNRANFACESCDAADRTLHVHHRIYRKGAMPWEYEDYELIALCESCHAVEHELRARLNEAIAIIPVEYLEYVVGFAEGFAAKHDCAEVVPILSAEHAAGISAAFSAQNPHDVLALIGEGTKEVNLERLWELQRKRQAPDGTN